MNDYKLKKLTRADSSKRHLDAWVINRQKGEAMYILILMILFVPLILLNGWVLLNFWNWFVLPLGAPEITFGLSVGICVMLSFINNHYNKPEEETTEEKITRIGTAIVDPFLFLIVGWIIHLFL